MAPANTPANKIPFDIDAVLAAIASAVRPFPKAAMFELAERGYQTPFHQLVACIISIRTRDEESLPLSIRLFDLAPTPGALAALSIPEITAVIRASSFAERKAEQIQAIAQRVASDYGGELPCDEAVVRAFKGVGVKCANLTLGIACGQPKISVDIHVHRICNRWGYVATATPEQTTAALEAILPRPIWIEINALLVPFGKHLCTGVRPKCSTCPVLSSCRQVGVTSHQ